LNSSSLRLFPSPTFPLSHVALGRASRRLENSAPTFYPLPLFILHFAFITSHLPTIAAASLTALKHFCSANRAGGIALNPRQVDMLNRLLDGFEGKLTTGKWANISKCSPDTALRDINELVAQGILRKEAAGGRSTSYLLGAASR